MHFFISLATDPFLITVISAVEELDLFNENGLQHSFTFVQYLKFVVEMPPSRVLAVRVPSSEYFGFAV